MVHSQLFRPMQGAQAAEGPSIPGVLILLACVQPGHLSLTCILVVVVRRRLGIWEPLGWGDLGHGFRGKRHSLSVCSRCRLLSGPGPTTG